MAKVTFTRSDIENLVKRLMDCGKSPLLDDMPSLQHTMRSAAALLRHFVSIGVPVTAIEIDV